MESPCWKKRIWTLLCAYASANLDSDFEKLEAKYRNASIFFMLYFKMWIFEATSPNTENIYWPEFSGNDFDALSEHF